MTAVRGTLDGRTNHQPMASTVEVAYIMAMLNKPIVRFRQLRSQSRGAVEWDARRFLMTINLHAAKDVVGMRRYYASPRSPARTKIPRQSPTYGRYDTTSIHGQKTLSADAPDLRVYWHQGEYIEVANRRGDDDDGSTRAAGDDERIESGRGRGRYIISMRKLTARKSQPKPR
ncbi:hypothetical protein B0H34DRAFT_838749 [Crassisporium funariophilum]|nr:hypothetical protein B0H34DRAFT_838749 [Crassisporium funariophilum]